MSKRAKPLKNYTQDELAVIRLKCENDFSFFVRFMFYHQYNVKFRFSWHHTKICKTLEDVFLGKITHLIVNMPPRYSKTELIVKLFSAWCFMKNSSCEFIHLSYSDPLALSNSNAVKDIIKSDAFRLLWPNIVIRTDMDSKKAWGTSEGGVFYATSAGGSVTGFGAGKVDEKKPDGSFNFGGAIIIDDPLKPDDAKSNVKRKSVNDRWDETIKSRTNNDSTPVIVVMQRLHDDDFCGMLLGDDSGEYNWYVLNLPAILDEGEETERALWPDKHSIEKLKLMRKKNPYVFNGQYMQSPAPLGGGIFKEKDWQYYNGDGPLFSYRVIVADTALKAKTYNDYSVMQCWGVTKDGLGYLIDQIRGKWESPELKRRAVSFWNKHKSGSNGRLRVFGIEDKASGTGLIQSLKSEERIPVCGIKADVDKVTRALDAAPKIENGFIFLPEGAEFLSEYVQEFSAFTADDTHKHDDQIDTTVHFINEFLNSSSGGSSKVKLVG